MIAHEAPRLYESVNFSSTPIKKVGYADILKHQEEAKTLKKHRKEDLTKKLRSICLGKKEAELQRKTGKWHVLYKPELSQKGSANR